MTAETVTYTTVITLTTSTGECPDMVEMQELVESQMAGELDETTGLTCIGVTVTEIIEDID